MAVEFRHESGALTGWAVCKSIFQQTVNNLPVTQFSELTKKKKKEREREREKEREGESEYCQIKSKRGSLIGMPWLLARTLTLLANLPGKSFILLKAGDKFCQALPVLIIHLLLFSLLCKRRGLRAAQKIFKAFSIYFSWASRPSAKIAMEVLFVLVGQKC